MPHRDRVYDSILGLLPSEENPTPMVRINASAPPGSTLYAKLEWYNPFGSIKDRGAWEMIRTLELEGTLGPRSPGRGIVEPSSGNTGLSLAGLAAARGYRVRVVTPARVPPEKLDLLRIAGAEVETVADAMCPMPGSEDGTIGLARTHARADPERWVMPNQYENRANPRAHERTTGPEIWRQTGGRVTHVFTALGTCGTAAGLAAYFKHRSPGVRLIAVVPRDGHDVPGLRSASELGASMLDDTGSIDRLIEVEGDLASPVAAELARREGLLAGPGSGLVFEGARRFAAECPVTLGVVLFCDSSLKYGPYMASRLSRVNDTGSRTRCTS